MKAELRLAVELGARLEKIRPDAARAALVAIDAHSTDALTPAEVAGWAGVTPEVVLLPEIASRS